MSQGYLWNAGMFIVSAGVLAAHLARLLPDMHARLETIARAWGTPEFDEVLADNWPHLMKIAIDHAGHSAGVGSDAWIGCLEEFDAGLSVLLRGLPAGVRTVMTADHGIAIAEALWVRESTMPPFPQARTSRSPMIEEPSPGPMSAPIWSRERIQALSPRASRQRASTSAARPSCACTCTARVSPATIRTPSRRAGV